MASTLLKPVTMIAFGPRFAVSHSMASNVQYLQFQPLENPLLGVSFLQTTELMYRLGNSKLDQQLGAWSRQADGLGLWLYLMSDRVRF